MLGLLVTGIKQQLGSMVNGYISNEFYIPAPSLQFAGTRQMMEEYQKRASALGTDPLGYTYPPYAYAAGQVLAKAVTETKSFDDDLLADYLAQVDLRYGDRADRLRAGRRMEDATDHLHSVPGNLGQRSRPVQGLVSSGRGLSEPIPVRQPDLSVRGREKIGRFARGRSGNPPEAAELIVDTLENAISEPRHIVLPVDLMVRWPTRSMAAIQARRGCFPSKPESSRDETRVRRPWRHGFTDRPTADGGWPRRQRLEPDEDKAAPLIAMGMRWAGVARRCRARCGRGVLDRNRRRRRNGCRARP